MSRDPSRDQARRIARFPREAFETLSLMGRCYFTNWLGNKPGMTVMMGDGYLYPISYLRAETLEIYNHNLYT